MTEKETKNTTNKEAVFSKEQLINSNSFTQYRDLLTVVIQDNERISKQEAKKRIETFLKRRVK